MSNTYKRIYKIVRQIPAGTVATYGQVARLAGIPRHARQVGYALNTASREMKLPWHRVINARGEISKRADANDEALQRYLLEEEGVEFDLNGRVSLKQYQWNFNDNRLKS